MAIFGSEVRIGVMGGSFNPVHCGHLRVASDVKQRLNLDHMFLMPAAQSPLKAEHSISVEHRVAMLERAITEFSELEVDYREVHRAGRSYTAESLADLRSEVGDNAYLYFVFGDDCLPNLNQWARWTELASLANLIITKRPGAFPAPPNEVVHWLRDRETDLDTIGSMSCGGVARIECALLDISSSELRLSLDLGEDLEQVIPNAVIEYIKHHRLYC